MKVLSVKSAHCSELMLREKARKGMSKQNFRSALVQIKKIGEDTSGSEAFPFTKTEERRGREGKKHGSDAGNGARVYRHDDRLGGYCYREEI